MTGDGTDQSPHVFITHGTDDDPAIVDIIHNFTLNEHNSASFVFMADHTFGKEQGPAAVAAGSVWRGGTGKSRFIAAVRAVLNRQNELVVTAPTGTDPFNVAGITLHSATNLPIATTKPKIGSKTKHWIHHQYLIVDEVSMMDCNMLVNLNTNLKEAKFQHDDYFGGINIILWTTFFCWLPCRTSICTSTSRQNGSMVIIDGDPSISSSCSQSK